MKLKMKNVKLVKSGLCKLFWYLFVLQALYIIYLIFPKPIDPIIVLTQDFAQISGPNVIREGELSGEYRVSVKKDLDEDVNVTLAYSGTAEDVLDYVAKRDVVIKKGELSANFQIQTLDDPFAEFNEEFAVKIFSINGERFLNEYNVSDYGCVIHTKILDEKNPKHADKDSVEITIKGPPSVDENNVTATYTLELSREAVEDIELRLDYNGSAERGVDYVAQDALQIKKGQKSATFTITTIDDMYRESNDTIHVFISGLDDIGFEDVRYASAELNIDVKDEKEPTQKFTLSLDSDKTVFEGKAIGYAIKSEVPVLEDIAFTFKINANDNNSYDKEITALMKKGDKELRFSLEVIDDNVVEKRQDISLELQKMEYRLYESIELNALKSKTIVLDNKDAQDRAKITLSLKDDSVIYEDSKAFEALITSSQTLKKDLTFSVEYAGSATNKIDFIGERKVKIRKNQNEAKFSIRLLNDNILENKENILIALSANSSGGLEKIEIMEPLSVAIYDEKGGSDKQAAIISLKGPSKVSEPQRTSKYTIGLSQVLEADLLVNLSYGESLAQIDKDFTPLQSVIVKKGSKSATFELQTLDDEEAEHAKDIVVKLESLSGGGLESVVIDDKKNKVTTTLTDEEDIAALFKKLVSSKKIIFKSASDKILDESFPVLDDIAKLLQRFPKANLIVEGHTNSDGNKKRNLKLSKRRALSVMNYLIEKGIDKTRLESIGYGQERPMAPDSNPNAMELNKRVEFKVKYKGIK